VCKIALKSCDSEVKNTLEQNGTSKASGGAKCQDRAAGAERSGSVDGVPWNQNKGKEVELGW
jgi:hypothetical protein